MNRIYRSIWNEAAGSFVAAPEIASGKGGRACRSVCETAPFGAVREAASASAVSPTALSWAYRPLAAAMFVGLFGGLTTPVWALPQDGVVAAGNALISSSQSATGPKLSVQQNSSSAIINWKSFSIGAGETVQFLQPGASAVALNRVWGADPSQIFGSLQANGRVFLLNPNGILFGRGAQVNTGGLLASTRQMSDPDFLAGRYRLDGSSPASVTNLGSLRAAEGGFVVLAASQVNNEGEILARRGAVALAAGERIALDLHGDGLVNVSVDAGAVGAAVRNAGTISADGGSVLLSAKAADGLVKSVVNNSGLIQAQTIAERNGTILLMGDMQTGTVEVGGTLDASAPAGGKGGFIETSAAKVEILEGARVRTTAASGEGGRWLIDPVNYTIAAAGGDITGTALGGLLAGGNITISAVAAGAGNGDIFVNDTVAWSANELTLNAYSSIFINNSLNGSGTAKLALNYGQGAVGGVSNSASYFINGTSVNLPAGPNFRTTYGSDGVPVTHTVITDLGSQGTNTADSLQGLTNNLGGNYVLGANIDAAATAGWTGGFNPIGTGSRFNGTLDGLGHSISNLSIARGGSDNVGLFSVIGPTGRVQNLSLIGGTVAGKNNVGALAGSTEASPDKFQNNITSSVTVNAVGNNAGGLVGQNAGNINYSSSSGTVTAGAQVAGGLVGLNSAFGNIANSSASGAVSANTLAGGLVGTANGAVYTSFATGNVTATTGIAGGVAGSTGTAPFSNNYAWGNVTAPAGVGGIAGGVVGQASVAPLNVYSAGVVGGFVSGGVVGDFTGASPVGGFWNNTVNPALAGVGTLSGVPVAGTDVTTGISTAAMQTVGGVTFATAPTWKQAPAQYPTLAKVFLVQPLGGSSVYGTTPALTYTLVDTQSQPIGYGSTVVLTGAATYAGAPALPLSTSAPATYTLNYNGGLALAGTGAAAYEIDPLAPIFANWTVTPATLRYRADPATRSYGNANPAFTGSVSGLVNGDTLVASTTGAATFSSTATTASNVGSYAINGSGLTGNGTTYQAAVLQDPTNATALTVSARPISVTANDQRRTYGSPNPTTGATTLTVGTLVNGDTLGAANVSSTATATTAAGLTAALTPSAQTFTAGNASNYAIAYLDGTLAIDKRSLTAGVVATGGGTFTKTYDGNSGATLAAGNFALTGLVSGEGITVTQTAGTFDSPNAGVRTVNATLAGTDFTAAPGTSLANYTLPTTATGAASIAQRTVTAGIVAAGGGTFTKTYDGNSAASLVPGNFAVTGWATGESATVSQTVGGFDSPNAGTRTVSATLGAANFAPAVGTNLANYVLPATASSPATIAQRSVSASIVGTIGKTYDGSSAVSLNSGNYSVLGWVTGEGATVTQTVGGFDSPNAGNRTVSASLGVGDFTAAAGTNLANYALPSSASGPGSIAQRSVTASIVAPGGGTFTKTYDGNSTASLSSGNFATSGWIGGEGASVTQTTGTFDSPNAGNRTVSAALGASGFAPLGATNLGNYVLPASASTAAVIDKAKLTVTANDASKTYDGKAFEGGAGVRYAGLVAGQTAANLGGALAYSGSSQGATNAGSYAITPGGLNSDNYAIQFESAKLQVNPKSVTVTGLVARSKVFDGTKDVTIDNWGRAETGVGNQTLVLERGSASFDDAAVRTAQGVTATGYRIVGGENGALTSNYVLGSTIATTTADILAKPATDNPLNTAAPTTLASLQTQGRIGGSGSAGSGGNPGAGSTGLGALQGSAPGSLDSLLSSNSNAVVSSTTTNNNDSGGASNPGATAGAGETIGAGGTGTGGTGGTGTAGSGTQASSATRGVAAFSSGSGSSASGSTTPQTTATPGAGRSAASTPVPPGTQRFASSGFVGRPPPATVPRAVVRTQNSSQVFLRGASRAEVVGRTAAGDVLVASVTQTSNGSRMEVTVAEGDSSVIRVGGGRSQPTLDGGAPLPSWLRFNAEDSSLSLDKLPAGQLPLTLRFAAPGGNAAMEVVLK